MVELIIIVIGLIFLTVGSYTDFKTREVPDWLNFSLIAIGFVIHILASIIFWDISYIIKSISGFLLCLIIALIMFYAGQWGGGDSKMIMGLGALIGLDVFAINFTSFSLMSFLVNIIVVGALYGLVSSIALTYIHRKAFIYEFKKRNTVFDIFIFMLAILSIIVFFIIPNHLVQYFLIITFLLLLLWLLWNYIKIVEKVCMVKYVAPDKLTEGDWIVNEVKVKGKYITGPKELGITKDQLKAVMKYHRLGKIKKVLIKEGIPFVPSFWISFVVTLIWGNLIILGYTYI